jgi:hypothetical protein
VYRSEKGHIPVLAKEFNGEPVIVRRDEVKSYVEDPIFLYYLEIYHYTKMWGLPNGRGWAHEPMNVLVAISALEVESREMDNEEINNGRSTNTATGQFRGTAGD